MVSTYFNEITLEVIETGEIPSYFIFAGCKQLTKFSVVLAQTFYEVKGCQLCL